jgi:hypothetical protein
MQRDHSEVVRQLLTRAISIYDPSRPSRHRFKAFLSFQLAEEFMLANVSLTRLAPPGPSGERN